MSLYKVCLLNPACGRLAMVLDQCLCDYEELVIRCLQHLAPIGLDIAQCHLADTPLLLVDQ